MMRRICVCKKLNKDMKTGGECGNYLMACVMSDENEAKGNVI